MPHFERSAIVERDPSEAFRYLSDVRRLPEYVATMVEAERADAGRLHVAADVDGRHESGDAYFRADSQSQRLEWSGREGSGYSGWLQIDASGPGGSEVTIHLQTIGRHDVRAIEQALQDTLSNIQTRLTER